MAPNTFSKEDSVKVKGAAIILMLIHHCFVSPSRYEGQEVKFFPFSEAAWNEWALYFKICVAIFVFISAYGMTVSFKNLDREFDIPKTKMVKTLVVRYIKLISSYMFVFAVLQIYSLVMQKGRFTYVYGNKPTSFIYMLIDMFGLADLLKTPTFIATFWYMSLAQIIIIIIPFLIGLYRWGGGFLLIAAAVFAAFVPQYEYAYFPWYIICIATGILCADKNFFAALKSWPDSFGRVSAYVTKTIRFAIYILLLYEMERLREGELKSILLPIFDAIIPVIIIGFLIEFINPLPVIGNILKVLGRHSINIFLVHNFIRVVWYYDFTYSFKYAGVIVLVLIGISLCVSVCLEWIKKLVHFNQIVDRVIQNAVK